MTHPPRRFYLQRDTDITGVSGTGHVADGVIWPDDTVTIRWVGDRPSTVHWDTLANAAHVHGHGGHTRLVAIDQPDQQPAPDLLAVIRTALEGPALTPADQAVAVLTAIQGQYVPPPPGSDRDKLPDDVLALINVPVYLSTGCEIARALETAAEQHPEMAGELREWARRKHLSCRHNNKSTGQLCICTHHQEGP